MVCIWLLNVIEKELVGKCIKDIMVFFNDLVDEMF